MTLFDDIRLVRRRMSGLAPSEPASRALDRIELYLLRNVSLTRRQFDILALLGKHGRIRTASPTIRKYRATFGSLIRRGMVVVEHPPAGAVYALTDDGRRALELK